MARFSSRFNYDPRLPKNSVLEDAPEGMRIFFMNSILQPLVWHQGDNEEGRPLVSYLLIRDFCSLARQEIPAFPGFTDSWDDLKSVLAGAAWFNFYDFVEHVGSQLKSFEQDNPFGVADTFGFETYRNSVNELFEEDRIGWRLNSQSELERQVHPSLAKRLAAADSALGDRFEPARAHYQKAIQYTLGTQPDPENAIKEVTSAIESVGRVLYPMASTLGKVVKEMEKEKSCPPMLLSVIEKYYAYASSEPAVRHGGAVVSRVLPRDAEFCLHVGAAIIRYLLDSRSNK